MMAASKSKIFRLVKRAWQAFDRAADFSWCVKPAVPILFFGDLDAYRDSPLRVLTVGLNPSRCEFPDDKPFQRFPLAEGSRGRKPSHYLDAMSAYFRTDPYWWFSSFEPLLNGMEARYCDIGASTALHTDICSPVATNPTWNKLDENAREFLERDGGKLWRLLLKELRPQIVVLSVAREYLERIKFKPITDDWKSIHSFVKKRNGKCRKSPYKLWTRWYDVGGEKSLFAFGQAAQTPFGTLADVQKQEAGKRFLRAYTKNV